jgi:Raf kinase inhibitor-like YbhB/YbcL family protein
MRRGILLTLVLLTVLLLVGCSQSSADTSESEEETASEGAASEDASAEEAGVMRLTSTAFDDGGTIPAEYCNVGVEGGKNVSVPLEWTGAPEDAKSFALIMVDHHEVANEWVHWAVIGMPAGTSSLAEGASASGMPPGTDELLSTSGEAGYQGPAPPPGSGDHEYETQLYALDVESVDVAENATYEEFLAAVEPHAIAEAALSGFFGR